MSSLKDPVDVLLVEDNPSDVELSMRAFRKIGLADRVQVLGDAEQALDYLLGRGPYQDHPARAKPRVVLLDVNLPGMSGIAFLARLREQDGLRTIPVILLTSSADDGEISRSYELGANSYIVKPIDAAQLERVAAELAIYWLNTNQAPSR